MMKENIEIQSNETQSLEGTYQINKPLKLNTVHEGDPTDNVLVYGSDKEVRSVPRSEFGGGAQNLDDVLSTGNQSNIDIILGDPVTNASIINPADGFSNSAGFGKTFYSAGGATFIHPNDDGHTSLSMYDSNSRGFHRQFNLPDKQSNGNWTLASLDDISTPNLQEIFNQSKSEDGATVVANINNGLGSTANINLYANNGDPNTNIYLHSSDTTTGHTGIVGGQNGLAIMNQYLSGHNTKLSFEDPIDQNTEIKIPAKPGGTYLLSTIEDINTTNLVNNSGYTVLEEGNAIALMSGSPYNRTVEFQVANGNSSDHNRAFLGLYNNAMAAGGDSAENQGSFLVSNGIPYIKKSDKNSGTNSTISFESKLSGNTVINFPNKPDGVYTLATTSDIPIIKTVTLEEAAKNGQEIFDKSIFWNEGDGDYITRILGGVVKVTNNLSNREIEIGDLSIRGGEINSNTKLNKLDFSKSIQSASTFKFPENPSGVYTLATTSDLASLSSGAITYSPITPSALIRSGRTDANYISTPGVNSTDLSISNQATGLNGTKGSNSVSIGFNNRTDGVQSITIGTVNFASSIDDIAIGAQNTTGGGYAVAVGRSNNLSMNVSGAFGDSNIISGVGYSSGVYAIGRDNKIVSPSYGSIIVAGVGNNVTSGTWSSVFGMGNSGTTGMFSTIIGIGNNAPSFQETVLGTYATAYTPASTTAVDLTDRLFTIGNGVDNANRSNALVMLKSGVTTLPTVNNSLIAAEPTGKALITKEYLGTTGFTVNGTLIPLGGSMTFTAPTQLTTTSKLASAFSNSTTTRNTVSGWTFAVTAGKTYKIEIIGAYQTTALTTGGSIGFILTGGGTGTIMGKMDGEILQTTVNTGVRTTIRAINDINTTAGSFMTTTGVGVINSPHYIGGILNFSCTTNGTFEVQFGSEVASSAAQLNAGSLLLITEY